MPSLSLIYVWLRKRADFLELYARAREYQLHVFADEILEIADEPPQLIFEICKRTGKQIARVDPVDVQRKKTRIDARKWMAAKLQPRKYGLRR